MHASSVSDVTIVATSGDFKGDHIRPHIADAYQHLSDGLRSIGADDLLAIPGNQPYQATDFNTLPVKNNSPASKNPSGLGR